MEPEETAVTKERLRKRASAVTDTYTIEGLLEVMISIQSAPRL
jgi:hypothetical protein